MAAHRAEADQAWAVARIGEFLAAARRRAKVRSPDREVLAVAYSLSFVSSRRQAFRISRARARSSTDRASVIAPTQVARKAMER